MTERLYYDDAYLTEFEAVVLACESAGEAYRVRLDRSAFYPTSGGQPFDTGTLDGARVTDVCADDAGEVWHTAIAPIAIGARVKGKIDWARRFDHMQQHAGEHMLANAVYRQLNGYTIGLHLGADASTIDVTLPGGETRISEEALARLEDDVNARIQRDVSIRCWFPDAQTLSSLPLRKPPAVAEHVRVVQIGEEEFCACGGTHPSSAGQIGLVKILDARPSRGKMRITFVCGMRAFLDYRRRFISGERAASLLSADAHALGDAVSQLISRARDAEYALSEFKREMALGEVPAILARADSIKDARIASHVFSGIGERALREVASRLIAESGVIALIADETPKGCMLIFARAEDVVYDMGALLKNCTLAFGGKGGGKPDFAQGSATSAAALAFAQAALEAV